MLDAATGKDREVYKVGDFLFTIANTNFGKVTYYIKVGLWGWDDTVAKFVDFEKTSFADFAPTPKHSYATITEAKKHLAKILIWIEDWLKVRGDEARRLSFMCRIY